MWKLYAVFTKGFSESESQLFCKPWAILQFNP